MTNGMSNIYHILMKDLFRNLPYSFQKRAYTDILFVSDGANWVLSWEMKEIRKIAGKIGIKTRATRGIPFGLPRQSIFFSSKYILRQIQRYALSGTRIAFPYFHGYPDSAEPVAVECYENLKRSHQKICRIQVSHSKMHNFVLGTGIDPSKVFLIPIGINMDFFQHQSSELRKAMRDKHGIPQQATVIGSFQKDGNGWDEGNDPKLIKGPDVFLEALKILRESVPDIFVLLSGPARGYVKRGLGKIKIPYKHIYLEDYPQIGELYQCLDLYIIASREEGGPKAILESMASGVPLVTTRVGQAMDLVEHGKNGWMVDVEDAEGLGFWAKKALEDTANLEKILVNGSLTAMANNYNSQTILWKEFFHGFVDNVRWRRK